MPFVPDSDSGATGRFVPDPDEKPPKKSGALETVKDYAGDASNALGEGAMGIQAGVGQFIQAPAANMLSGVAGAKHMVDRGLSWLTEKAGGDGALHTETQDDARRASAFAADQRATNVNAKDDSGTAWLNPRTVIARVGVGLQEDARARSGEIQQDNRQNAPELIQQQQALGDAEGFLGTLKAIKDNPRAFTYTLTKSLPDMGAGLLFARLAAAGKLEGAVAAGDAAAARVAAAGGTAEAQATAAKQAIEALQQQAVQRASAAGTLAEASSSANSAREGTFQQVMNLPQEKLDRSARYQELLTQTGDPATARQALANELADQAPLLTAAGTAAGTQVAARLVGGDATAKSVVGVDRLTGRELGRRVAGDTIEEGLQGLPEDAVQHGALVQADPTAKYDPAGSLAMNLAAGGAMGAGGHGAAYVRQTARDLMQDRPGAAPTAQDATQYPDPVSRGTVPAPEPSAAEKALSQPMSLTALDRAEEIYTEERRLTERLAELNDPAAGYGQMFDQERQQLAALADELAAERESITKTWPKSEPGARASFTTEAGARLEGQYALMRIEDLLTSHDANLRQNQLYPQELQPRARDRAASEMQVSGIVQKLDPARLGLSADATTGAPIVGADGLVESGNARTIALKRVYQANGQKAADYRQFLLDNAAQFGLSPEQIQSMDKPVLVRVRSTPVNRAEFARQANASSVAAMSPSEQAKSDAARIDSMEDLAPDEQGDFQTSRDFIRRFMARLPVTEQAGMIDSTGALSSSGYARVRNAVLAKAYGDSPVLMRMVESMDDNLRNVSKALMTAAPKVAQMRQAVAQGQRFDADITPDLMAAVEELSRLKDAGTSIQDALAQAGMFGDKYSQETRDLLQFLADNIRRPRRMAEFITAYMEALDAAGDPNQGSLLGETQAPAKGDLLNVARRQTEGEGNAQGSNTAGEAGQDPGTGQQGAGQRADATGGEGRAQGAGPAAAPGAEGEWVAFGPDTGTLGIPRAQMPQVKGKDRGALINYLEARGIGHESDTVPASSLKPTQAEYSRNKVDKFVESGLAGSRSVLVSSDGHVLDGHHQWLGHKERGEEINVIRLDAPIRELLEVVNTFPGVQRSEGAGDVAQLRAAAVKDFQDAMGDLAMLATKHTRAAMMPEDTPGLTPILVRLFDAALRIVGTDMRAATRWVRDQLRKDPATKKIANFIKNSTMEEAARQALANLEKSGAAAQSGLFDSPEQATQALQSDLFAGQAETLPEPVKVAKINGRAYDMKRDNFKPPATDSFLPADVLVNARDQIARLLKDAAPEKVSDADRTKAEALLRPIMKRAEDAKAAYDQKIIDIVESTGALGQMLAPVKSLDSAMRKLVNEVNFDTARMYDMLRSTIVVSSYADAQAVLDAIRGQFDVVPGRIKNMADAKIDGVAGKFLASGYGQVLLNVKMPNGVIAEIQINVPEMLAVKSAEGHALYEIERAEKEGSKSRVDAETAQREIYPLAAAAAEARNAASLDGLDPNESGKSRAGVKYIMPDSSLSPNTRPSGNLTNSVASPLVPNSQPAGNSSGTGTGTDIASSSRAILPPSENFGQQDSARLEALRKDALRIVRTGAFAKEGISVREGGALLFNGAQIATLTGAKTRANMAKAIQAAMGQQAKSDLVSKTPVVDAHEKVMAAVRDGTATPEQFKASFEAVVAGKDAILAELSTKTKAELLRDGGYFLRMRYANESKPEIIDAAYHELVDEYVLGETLSYGMGKGAYEAAVRSHVAATDADKLAQYAKDRQAAVAEAQAKGAARAAALENPQTLDDYRTLLNVQIRTGKTRKEAFLMLTPEQRIAYDALEAESTREARETRKRQAKTEVKAAGQSTAGEIIATKHTRDGYDLFVVQLADRVSKEDYQTLLGSAKRMGGWYSSFRGNGAIPGFQFKDKAQAEAFKALAGGDTTAAQEQAAARRDAFEDDRSQTAVERLTTMADKLDAQANESLSVERKANTARRARFAASAEAAARHLQALAKTMRNIAEAIGEGKAKFLDAVRQKTQVEMLTSAVRTAKDNELRAKYPAYADQEKRRGQPPTAETADYAEFPSFTAFRSDLATLARQMLEVDGAKKMGAQLMKVADDVTDAYMAFAKANQLQVSQFGNKAGGPANFSSREDAERAINRSGLVGKAIVLPVKRGENRVILSPSEATSRGIWTGDGDKRITLTRDFGNELVKAIGRRGNKSNGLSVPWQFENAADRLKALARIGIETPAEFRSALREFIGLQEQAQEADKVKMLERAMIGKAKDGLDFFPTPQAVADQMVESAGIEPDMAVLEPSAGMGHIADRIREAGAEPDVIEMASDRKELLKEKGYHVAGSDFLDMKPREFYTYGDVFRAPDGTEGVMRGLGGLGSDLVRLVDDDGVELGKFDRDDLTGVRHRGTDSGYDRIIMNPPFSDRRDAQHVQHAYTLLKPGGRIVTLMGEGVFFGQDKKAEAFRDWLEEVGGTDEKLPAGTFMDSALPVNTGTNARMVVIDKPAENLESSEDGVGVTQLSRGTGAGGIAVRDLQAVVDRVSKGLKNLPKVHVFASPADLSSKVPDQKSLRDYIKKQGAMADAEGGLHNGAIYLFASGLADEARAEHVLATHEITHYGLRGAMGKGLDAALQHVWVNNTALRKQAAEARQRLGLDSNLAAVEEVLADIPASELVKLQGWRRVVKAARDWLNRIGATSMAARLDQWLQAGLDDQARADLFVADLLTAAREWVRTGRGGRGGSMADVTRLSSLAEDAAKQEKWLTAEAKARGYKDIEDLLEKNYPVFEKLAAKWREKHPASDGVMLSRGDMTQTPAFRKWFGDSKVVDAQGKPLVVYHGTAADFDKFRTAQDLGAHFGTTAQANMLTGRGKGSKFDPTGGNVMPVYLSIKNPLRLEDRGEFTAAAVLPQLEEMGLVSSVVASRWSQFDSEGALGVEKLQRFIEKAGYDGVVYLNRREGFDPFGPDGVDGNTLDQMTDEEVMEAFPDAQDSWIAFRPEQIKSAAGNRGTFDPTNSDIRLSRAPQAATPAQRADKILAQKVGGKAPLDAVARAVTQITGVNKAATLLYKAPLAAHRLLMNIPGYESMAQRVAAGVVADYGVPEAVIDQRAMMQGRQRVQLRKAGALIEKLATLTRAESRVAYEWMNMDGSDPKAYLSAMEGLPEESVKVLQEVQQMIDKLSREAVALGQLSPDAYERNRMAYLRRSYAKHVIEQTTGEKAKRARVISILGDQYKGRGLTEAAPMARIQNTAPEWWARKLQAGKGDAGLKGEKFVRLERRAPAGAGTQALPGMTTRPEGKLLEVAYYPAGRALPAQFKDWEQRGTFEVRDVKGPNLILWRDFTKEEREQMGEVDEARFAIAKTMHGMIHDVEVGRYLEWIGHTYAKKEGETIPGKVVEASERFKDTFAPGEWVRVPDSKIPGTTVAKYGKLAGRYIPGPIWNDLRQVVGGQFKPFGDTYAKVLTLWKTAKTALSPAVHMNNVMSNFVMADWHDVSPAHVAKALRLILAASQRQGKGALGRAGNLLARAGIADREAAAEILTRYKDAGGDIGSWATNEIARDQLEPLLESLEKELAATAGASQQAQVGVMAALQHAIMLRFPSAWDAFKESKPGKVVGTEAKSLIDLYQSEDDVFRLAAWLKAKEEGRGDLEAGKVARRSFLDYHINAPWIQAMRNSGWPFISFTYRAVPMMLEIAGKKPHKLLKLMALAGALNALGTLLAGGGDDERKLLPEEKAGRIWGIVPKLIRMPWNDTNGHPVYLDIRRYIPVGDVFDVGQGHSAIPVLPGLQPGGPMAVFAELMVNRSMFTGKPITLDTDTAMQKAAKVSDYLYKAFAPNVLGLPGTYATTGVLDAAQGKTDAFGRQQSVAQATASAFGVKLGSYPADVLRLNLTRKTQAEIMEINRNITLLQRQRASNAIDQKEFEDGVKAEQAKQRKLVEKLREKVN